jgi:hypothetical protein
VFIAYDYTPAIWYARRHMRKVPVRIDYPRCSASSVWVPIPAGAVPDPGTEGHMVVAQFGTGIEYDFPGPAAEPKAEEHLQRTVPDQKRVDGDEGGDHQLGERQWRVRRARR